MKLILSLPRALRSVHLQRVALRLPDDKVPQMLAAPVARAKSKSAPKLHANAPLQQFKGHSGHWITMHGHHVFLTGAGQFVAHDGSLSKAPPFAQSSSSSAPSSTAPPKGHIAALGAHVTAQSIFADAPAPPSHTVPEPAAKEKPKAAPKKSGKKLPPPPDVLQAALQASSPFAATHTQPVPPSPEPSPEPPAPALQVPVLQVPAPPHHQVIAPEPEAAPPVEAITKTEFVTIHGIKVEAQPKPTVGPEDVEALKIAGVPITANGEAALKAAIEAGQIDSHQHLLEIAALAQASSQTLGHKSINGPGVAAMLEKYPGIVPAKLSAEVGDATAESIVAKLGPHSMQTHSEKAAAAAQEATHKAQFAAQESYAASAQAFSIASANDHLHTQIGPKAGFNAGGLYQLPDGSQNYIKTLPSAKAGVAHNEHLANAIYNALGHSAPQSKVFAHDGQTHYASLIIPNAGELKAHGGAQMAPEMAQTILKGFAADALLGNRDVLGNGDRPWSNVVVGHVGEVHRIDNGGALLKTGVGGDKQAAHLMGLPEWDGFTDAKANANYAAVFARAGYTRPEEIPGIGAQIKAIVALRDAHGGWQGFVDAHAPNMDAAQRTKTAQVLETRTAQLETKLKGIAGHNTTLGTRNYPYHGAAHEEKILEHHKAHAPKLSAAEKKAVASYKGSGFYSINQANLGTSAPSDEVKERIATLDAMFQKPGMTIGHDSVLSRKISVDEAEIKMLQGLQPGAVLPHTPVFQSTSVNSSVWQGNVHFCIHAPAETPGVPPKASTKVNQQEQEILLPRGLSYRVVSVSGPNNSAPAHTPEGWTWQANATRVVVEAIVPGINDVEGDYVPVHQVSSQKIKDNWQKLHASGVTPLPAPNLSALPAAIFAGLPTAGEPPGSV